MPELPPEEEKKAEERPKSPAKPRKDRNQEEEKKEKKQAERIEQLLEKPLEKEIVFKKLTEAKEKIEKELTKKAVNELKALKKPPQDVISIFEIVCVLFGKKESDALKILADPSFIDQIKNYDKENLDEKIM